MKEKSKNTPHQQEVIMAFLRFIAAKPSKRYPVFVWKVPSIFPDDLAIMFDRWLSQSKYRDSCPFAKKKHFFQALYSGFDEIGLNWHIRVAYRREKIYFSNLRLKESGCRLLMDIGAKTYIEP